MPNMSVRPLSLPIPPLKRHDSHQTWGCHISCGSCSALYNILFQSRCRCSCTSWVEMCIPTRVWRFGPKCPKWSLSCTTQPPQHYRHPYSKQVFHQPWSPWKTTSQPSPKTLPEMSAAAPIYLKALIEPKWKILWDSSYSCCLGRIQN